MPLAEPHHVVVDGSNLATEGRTSPSLAQLNEAVSAFAAEDPSASIIVVVDATFEHRVSEKERDKVRKAMLNGEIVSPPAGAIGRGDAFVLRIAERTGATVLSNDSFQEFHGEHPWLFDEGRLIGGKPIPGVGWIFTPRVPIRGAKSRAATAEARAARDPESAPAKAAELARAAKKAAKKAAKATRAAATRATKAAQGAQTGRTAGTSGPVDTSWPMQPAMPPPGRAKVDPAFSSALEDAVEEALYPEARKAKPAAKKQGARKQASARKAAPEKSARAKAKKDAGSKPGQKDQKQQKEQRQPKDQRQQREGDGKGAPTAGTGRGRKKKRVTPPPAVNEPLAFINFVAAYPVGSVVEGEVVSFTSHGAMVDVSLPGGGALHCYIPLTAMGNPPPTKARHVLKKGEARPFVLAGLDPPRRVAELAIPGPDAAPPRRTGKKRAPAPAAAEKAATPPKKGAADRRRRTAARATAPAKQQPAKQKAVAAKKGTGPAKKAPVKKQPAKKQAAPRPPAKKQTAARKQPAKKQTATKKPLAKKQPARKQTVGRQPAGRQAVKKQPAKTRGAKKASRGARR